MINQRLLSFITVVETKSFTQAGDVLHLTQPAISQQIKSLEDEFGISLFRKEGRQLLLTREGAYLLKYARRMKTLDDTMYHAVDEYKKNRRRLDIGMTPTASEYLIPRLFTTIFADNPAMSINFHVHAMPELYERMRSYEFDFSICDEPMYDKHYTSTEIYQDSLSFICGKESPIAKKKGLVLSDLRDERLILRHRKSLTRSLFDAFLSLHNDSIDNYHVILEIESIPIIKELVAKDYGITVLPLSVCRQELSQESLVRLFVEGFSIERGTYLIYPTDTPNHALMERLRSSLSIA